MSSHETLVELIRGVHRKLRNEYRKDNDELDRIWENHIMDEVLRTQYSQAMLELATKCWSSTNNRITWCYKILRNYYFLSKYEKELSKISKQFEGVNFISTNSNISVLDVGSCYNPFQVYQDINSLAIDLTPAAKGVYQADFLKIEITEHPSILSNPIESLQKESFDAVVFSLVLEYLPSPHQRWMFCYKANLLLKLGGLLIIITPDSKKPHHNAPRMKQWKITLENLGFSRLIHEKQPHLHCMAFIKRSFPNPQNNKGFIFIPQDFSPVQINAPNHEIFPRSQNENENVKSMFDLLPSI